MVPIRCLTECNQACNTSLTEPIYRMDNGQYLSKALEGPVNTTGHSVRMLGLALQASAAFGRACFAVYAEACLWSLL